MSKFYITYFYNIRYFPGTLVPVSTLVWDPPWYHDNKGPNHIFIDKRWVINGVRALGLSPTEEHIHMSHNSEEMCKGHETCAYNPESCKFLSNYWDYLQTLDFNETIKIIEDGVHKLRSGADICLIVNEKPDNPCSERVMLKKWFMQNGVELKEWDKSEVDSIVWS